MYLLKRYYPSVKSIHALRTLAELTASQWGMVTSAQASHRGVSRLDLSRLCEAGQLARLSHGVYRTAGAPSGADEDIRAAWLSTAPQRTAVERLGDGVDAVVVSGASAARLHKVGDLPAGRHEFTSATRRQSQRKEIHYRRRELAPGDVTTVNGLPTTTIERTIADLVETHTELTLVADVLSDAATRQRLDYPRLQTLLAPVAARLGFRRGDGAALLDRLLQLAGLDAESLGRRISVSATVGDLAAAVRQVGER